MKNRSSSLNKRETRASSRGQGRSQGKQNLKGLSKKKSEQHINSETQKTKQTSAIDSTIEISSQNAKKFDEFLKRLGKQVSEKLENLEKKDFQNLTKLLNRKRKLNILFLKNLLNKLSKNSNFCTSVSTVPDEIIQNLRKIFEDVIQSQEKNKKKFQLQRIWRQIFETKQMIPINKKSDTKFQPKTKRQYQQVLAVYKKGASKPKQSLEIEKKNKKNQSQLILKIERPICPKKGCCPLEDKICPNKNHLMVICQKCKWTDHECSQTKQLPEIESSVKINIIAKGTKIDFFPERSISRRQTKRNNIKQTVTLKKYKFTNSQRILPRVPQQILCFYPIINGVARDLIIQNRKDEEFLPLEIRQSKIPEAGLGVFTTVTINEADILVCSYTGQIGIGSRTPILRKSEQNRKNDSIFTLGWLSNEILIMAPNIYSNVGRFINYNTPQKCNLKPNLCLIETSEKEYEIAVFLTTTRKINSGEQLYYNYGNDYYV